jgi:hypothetical protein
MRFSRLFVSLFLVLFYYLIFVSQGKSDTTEMLVGSAQTSVNVVTLSLSLSLSLSLRVTFVSRTLIMNMIDACREEQSAARGLLSAKKEMIGRKRMFSRMKIISTPTLFHENVL